MRTRVCIVVAIMALAACTKDRAKQKAAYLTSGDRFAKAGKYAEAAIQFRNVIEIDSRFAEAHYKLGKVYLQLKSPQQGYHELSTAVDLDPGILDAQLELAALLLSFRQYEKAEKAAEKVIAAEPRNARAHTILGEKHALTEAWPLAIREFQTAIDLDSTKVENYAGLSFAYVSTGKTEEAEGVLRQATEVHPQSISALINLSRFYLMQHRFSDAERVCVELKSRAPNDPDGYSALASFYEATGQSDKAAAELQTLVEAKPADIGVKARLTDALLDLNQIEKASQFNKEVLRVNPGDPRALISKGRILVLQQKYADAKATLDLAVAADPQSASARYLLGAAESTLGLTSLARESFNRALSLSPEMAEAAEAVADLDVRTGDYDNALRLANQALQKNPDSTLASMVVARVSVARGNGLQAEAQLRSILDRDPVFFPALETLLEVQARQGRVEESIRRITTLLSRDPQNARLHFLLGAGYFRKSDLDRAETCIRQAIAIDPRTPNARGLWAEISELRGELPQAVARYRLAIEENPKKVEYRMALANLYAKQSAWKEAIGEAERAHAIDPSSPFVANNLAYLYMDHGDINLALPLAQQAKQKLPDSPVVSDTLGWLYYKLKLHDAAVTQLSESVQKAPGNPTYHYHLGMAYRAAGRPRDAASSLQRALSVNPHFPYAAIAKTTLHQIAKGAL